MAVDLETWDGFCRYLMEEEDDFRLAIRGGTALEFLAARLIAENVPGELQGELKAKRQGLRLALLVALDVIPPEVSAACLEINNLRNEFAHGSVNQLTRDRADAVWAKFEPIFVMGGPSGSQIHREVGEITVGRTDDGQELPPIWTLRTALQLAYLFLDEMANASGKHREAIDQLVALVSSSRFLVLMHRLWERSVARAACLSKRARHSLKHASSSAPPTSVRRPSFVPFELRRLVDRRFGVQCRWTAASSTSSKATHLHG